MNVTSHTKQLLVVGVALIVLLALGNATITQLPVVELAFQNSLRWVTFIVIVGAFATGGVAAYHYLTGNHERGHHHGKGILYALAIVIVGPSLLFLAINIWGQRIMPSLPSDLTKLQVPAGPQIATPPPAVRTP
jgi:hypothetical protein